MPIVEKQNKFVLDVTNQDIDHDQLSNIFLKVCNQQYGDILWNEERLPKDQISIDLIEKIKQQLIDNNNEYSRFPSDLTLGKFSHYVYRTDIKKDDKVDEIGPGWNVFDIFNEPNEDKSINEKKGSMYSGAIFINDNKHQIVLAHRGKDDNFRSLLNKDGQMVETFDGIWLKQIVPQLHICYNVTKEAHLLAEKKDYHLSFTGYSNGAWLAEHSIYFCNKYFRNNNTKAVLFESPGMVKSEDDEKPNIINHDTNFDFRDLNIVNYLTEPSFSNSINKHTGKTYRIFIEKKQYSLDFLDQLKKIPKIGNIIYDKINSSNFFIEGLLSSMTYQRLDSILEQFDMKTGKPKYYEEMHQWPKIKLNFDAKYKENLKNLVSKGVDKLCRLIPLPRMIKELSKKIMNWIMSSNFVERQGKNIAQGIWLLLNAIIELINQNIDFKKFDNSSFHKRLKDNYVNTCNGHNNEIKSECEDFINIESSYVPFKIENDVEQILKIGNESEKNIDWCLYHLQNINLEIGNFQSKLFIEQLEMLRKEYTIEIIKKKDFNLKDEILIKSVSNLRLEQIKERLARFLQIDPQLKKAIYNLTKSNLNLNSSLEICSNLDEKLKTFVGRYDELKKMKEIFFEKKKQFLALCAFGGTGKSALANFFGHIVQKDYKNFIIRWINSDSRSKIETQYRNMGDLLKITDKTVQFDFLVDRINGKLKIQNTNFLFVFDNLNNWNDIKDIVSSLPKNVKILLTLRNSGIVEKIIDEDSIINLKCFNQKEGVSFINKHLKYLNEEQKNLIITKIQFDGKIIPLQLNLIIRYFEENYTKEFSDLIGKLFDSRNENNLQVENNLFYELEKESFTTFKVLIYCAYLDPDYIGLNILKLFVNDSMIENHLKTIQKYGFIQILEYKKGIKMHRIIQEKIKEYHKKSKNYDSKEIISGNILKFFNEIRYTVDKNINLEHSNKKNEIRLFFIQVTKQLENLKNWQNEKNVIKRNKTELLNKAANFYFYLEINYKKAYEYYQRCYELSKILLGDIDHLAFASSLNSLGNSCSYLGYVEKALKHYKKSYAMLMRLFRNNDHPDLATSLNNLGNSYFNLGDVKEALKHFKKSNEMLTRLFGNIDRLDFASSLNSLGNSYLNLGYAKEALKYHTKCFEMRKKLLGNIDHPELAKSLECLGNTTFNLGIANEALQYHKNCNEMLTRLFGNIDHPDLASSLNSLGNSYLNQGNLKEALKHFKNSNEMLKRLFGDIDHPDIAASINSLANSYYKLENVKEALKHYKNSNEMLTRLFGDIDHPNIASSLNNLGRSYSKLGDEQKAVEHYKKCYEMRKRLFGNIDHPDLADSLNG